MTPEGGSRRIPSLDGLRAFSIALVIVSHLVGTTRFPIHDQRSLKFLGDFGYLGVRIFFVISGYLITTLLLKEHARTGTISLKEFYLRRAFRIFPAAYVFILVMLVVAALGAFTLKPGDAFHALTYTMNYHYLRSWELGHLWSLSVEEQFYLLWPALVLVVGPRRVALVAVLMIAAAPVMRVLAWFFVPSRDDVIFEAYPCVMDAIAAGSLLAVTQGRLAASARYQRFAASRYFAVVPLLVLVVNRESRVSFDYTVGITLQIAGIALCIDRAVRVREGLIYRVLNSGALVWIGTLSYSLYLWQEPFLNHRARALVNGWPVNLLLACACAVASYYLVEKPFFGLRDVLARRKRGTPVESATAP